MTEMFNEKALFSIRDYMLKTEETIAVAESVTSGFLQAAFSTTPDAAKFFQGGITTYNLGQKYRHLRVNPIHAENCNCVSPKVAEQMSLGICSLFSSQWGLGITGYATKVPEGDKDLHAHYAIAYNGEIITAKMVHAATKEGEQTQLHFVDEVLTALQMHLEARK
jgi:PncC family amidohydrolase